MPEFTCLFRGKTFYGKRGCLANEITSVMSTAPGRNVTRILRNTCKRQRRSRHNCFTIGRIGSPENITFSEGESIPSTIYIHCRSGKLPKVDSQKHLRQRHRCSVSILANRGNVKPAEPPARRRTTINCCKFCSVRLTRTFICGLMLYLPALPLLRAARH